VVLVIDDDPATRNVLGQFLAKKGFRVEAAATGEEGLAMARRLRPRAITLDVVMPGMDGWAVLSALKADPDLADIPVVMLTMVDDRHKGFRLGAADYLNKPVDPDRLTAVLRRHPGDPAARRVLVVDDDPDVRRRLRGLLEKDGWAVDEAADGREALDRLTGRPLSGSPLIDAGTDLSSTGFADDLDKDLRPQGAAWDIGADEFGGTPAPDTTAPSVVSRSPAPGATGASAAGASAYRPRPTFIFAASLASAIPPSYSCGIRLANSSGTTTGRGMYSG